MFQKLYVIMLALITIYVSARLLPKTWDRGTLKGRTTNEYLIFVLEAHPT